MRLFVSLLLLLALGLVVGSPHQAFADTGDEPDALAATQSDDDIIAKYPELADLVLDHFVTRNEEWVDLTPYNIGYDDFGELYKAILIKHPELFDVRTGYNGAILYPMERYQPLFIYPDKPYEEIVSMRQTLARGIAHAMSWIPADGSDLEKAKAAHDFLTAHVTYDSATYNSNPTGSWSDSEVTTYGSILTEHEHFGPYCAYGPLVEHSAVCEGISYAYKLLMDQSGIPCEYVTNPKDHHGWNHVMVDGEWYNVDATWDLPPYYNLITTEFYMYWEPDCLRYNYFLKSDDFIEALDQSKNKEEHVDYHNKYTNSKIYATSTLFDEYEDAYWEGFCLPDATYYLHEKTQVESFDLSSQDITLNLGETAPLSVQNVVPSKINPLASRWTSSNESVAYVCADGTIVAVGEGTAVITCTMGDEDLPCVADNSNEVTQICTVTVAQEASKTSIQNAIVDSIEDQEYTGEAIEPLPVVTLDGETLVMDQDYELSFENNIEVGQAKIIITGIGNYEDSISVTFEIVAPVEEPEVEFTTAQLLLGKQLIMRFGLSVPDGIDVSDGQAVFSIGGNAARTSEAIPFAEAEKDEGSGTHGFYFELSSVEMGEPITCTFTYGDQEVTRVASVEDYVQALDAYADEHPETARPLILNCAHAVLNYGHYVQPYLAEHAATPWEYGVAYKTVDNYYQDMNDVANAAYSLSSLQLNVDGEGGDDIVLSANLSLDSYTKFTMTIAPKVSGTDVTISSVAFGEEPCEVEQLSNGSYRISIDGIKAYQLCDTVTIKGTVDGESFTVTTSPMIYARAVLLGDFDETQKEALTSLYNYYDWSARIMGRV